MQVLQTIINHPKRIEFGLGLTEYCILDCIYSVQSAPGNDGWCDWKNKQIAEQLGITEQRVGKVKKQFEEEEWILINGNGYIQTTEKWYSNFIVIGRQKEGNKVSNNETKFQTESAGDVEKSEGGPSKKGKGNKVSNIRSVYINNIKYNKDKDINIYTNNNKYYIYKFNNIIYIYDRGFFSEVDEFLKNASELIPGVAYQMETKTENAYLGKQYREYSVLMNIAREQKLNRDFLKKILKFITQDTFRQKNIGSITKLLAKDRNGIPYWLVMKTTMEMKPKDSGVIDTARQYAKSIEDVGLRAVAETRVSKFKVSQGRDMSKEEIEKWLKAFQERPGEFPAYQSIYLKYKK